MEIERHTLHNIHFLSPVLEAIKLIAVVIHIGKQIAEPFVTSSTSFIGNATRDCISVLNQNIVTFYIENNIHVTAITNPHVVDHCNENVQLKSQ